MNKTALVAALTQTELPSFNRIELKDGRVLSNVRIVSINQGYVMARWQGGAGSIADSDLPDDVRIALKIETAKLSPPQSTQPSSEAKPSVPETRDQERPLATTTETPVAPPPLKQPTDLTGIFVALFVVSLLAFAIWAIVANRRAAKRRRVEMAARATRVAEQFQEAIKRQKGLAPAKSSLLLKKGEKAFFSEQSKLFETRAVRYGSGGAVRVAKGVWLSSNSSESTQEWRLLDEVILTVTNKRLVFDGNHTNRAMNLENILSVNPSLDSAEISVEGRQKSLVVTVSNGLIFATVVLICRQVENPEQIDPNDLRFTYKAEG